MDLKRLIAKGLRIILQPPAITNSIIKKTSKVCSGTNINDSEIGNYSYVGHDCFILNARIGSFVSIADNCRIGGARHMMENVSMSPVFQKGKNILKKNFVCFEGEGTPYIKIDSDVWIAANVTILSGVNIGTGSVVGAGSVVTRDIPPYEIWAGNPAKFIRKRFSDSIVEGLLDSKWWEFDDEKLSKYACTFDNPERFLTLLKDEE